MRKYSITQLRRQICVQNASVNQESSKAPTTEQSLQMDKGVKVFESLDAHMNVQRTATHVCGRISPRCHAYEPLLRGSSCVVFESLDAHMNMQRTTTRVCGRISPRCRAYEPLLRGVKSCCS